MASHEFFFAIEVSTQGAPAGLVDDLAQQIFTYVGCAKTSISAMTEAIERAVDKTGAAGPRRCDVQFRAGGGKIDVLISSDGSRIFQESIYLS
ncbi:MAG: hypothetical protein ABL961_09675 [Vicinamibacterales bacterium]